MGLGSTKLFGGIIVTDDEVNAFLTEMRAMMDANKFYFIPRDKNRRALAMLGISEEDAKQEIYDLKTMNYWSGPEGDDDLGRPQGEVWIFKRIVDGHLIYMKIKIHDDRSMLAAMSFHLDWK